MPKKPQVTGADIVADARRYLGVPYVYGGTNPKSGMDCSGLVYVVCHDLGISTVPRTSEEQFQWVQKVNVPGPGDLVFFVGSELDPPPGHVAIVVSPGQMIEEPYTGSYCRQTSFSENGTGVNKVMGYGRIPRVQTTASANTSIIGQSGIAKVGGEAAGAFGAFVGSVLLIVLLLVILAAVVVLIYIGVLVSK